jgi:hypothetical protein
LLLELLQTCCSEVIKLSERYDVMDWTIRNSERILITSITIKILACNCIFCPLFIYLYDMKWKILMKQQDFKSDTDQRLSSLNKRKPPTKLGAGMSNHLQKVSVGSQKYGCCLLSEAAIVNRRVTVTPSMHQVHTLALWGAKSVQNDAFLTFQVKHKIYYKI